MCCIWKQCIKNDVCFAVLGSFDGNMTSCTVNEQYEWFLDLLLPHASLKPMFNP